MAQNFISVKEASERFGYSGSHIRQLLLANKIEGQKFANAWMVDTTSLAQYKARMERLGKRKHSLTDQHSHGRWSRICGELPMILGGVDN